MLSKPESQVQSLAPSWNTWIEFPAPNQSGQFQLLGYIWRENQWKEVLPLSLFLIQINKYMLSPKYYVHYTQFYLNNVSNLILVILDTLDQMKAQGKNCITKGQNIILYNSYISFKIIENLISPDTYTSAVTGLCLIYI